LKNNFLVVGAASFTPLFIAVALITVSTFTSCKLVSSSDSVLLSNNK